MKNFKWLSGSIALGISGVAVLFMCSWVLTRPAVPVSPSVPTGQGLVQSDEVILGAVPSNGDLPGIYNTTPTDLGLRDGYGSALAVDQYSRLIISPSSTISVAAAGLTMTGGNANAMLFLDGSKNASTSQKLLADGNTGTLTASSTIQSTAGNIQTLAASGQIVCNATNANCTVGQPNGTGGILTVVSGGDTLFSTWNGSAFTPRITVEGNQVAGEVQVLGSVSSTRSLTVNTGSCATPSQSFSTDPDTGVDTFVPGNSGVLSLCTDSIEGAYLTYTSSQSQLAVRNNGVTLSLPNFGYISDGNTGLMGGALDGQQYVISNGSILTMFNTTSVRSMVSFFASSTAGDTIAGTFAGAVQATQPAISVPSFQAVLVGGTALSFNNSSGYEIAGTGTSGFDVQSGGPIKIGVSTVGSVQLYTNAAESLPQVTLSTNGQEFSLQTFSTATATKMFIVNATSTQIGGYSNSPTSTLQMNGRSCHAEISPTGTRFYVTWTMAGPVTSLTPCNQ